MSSFLKRIHYDAQAFLKSMIWEFKFIFRDKAVFSSFIGVAIVVSFIYGYVYSQEVLQDLPIVVVDQDNSSHSRQLIRMIDASEQVKVKSIEANLSDAELDFQKGQNRGIVVIPFDFSRQLQRGDQPTISVYADASYILYYKQVATAVKMAVSYMNAGVQVKKKSAQGNLVEVSKNKVLPVRGKVVGLYNPNAGYGAFLIPIVLVVIFQTTMLTAIGILGGTMREGKLMSKMYSHSNHFLGTLPIVMGKATVYLLFGILILFVMLGSVLPIYGISVRTSWLNVVVFLIPFLLSVVYLGIFIITFFARREDAILWIMFTSLPALLITGFSWPSPAMPLWLKSISYLVPSTVGAKGFITLTQMGASFQNVKNEWFMMWRLCLFFLILAVISTKRIYLIEKK